MTCSPAPAPCFVFSKCHCLFYSRVPNIPACAEGRCLVPRDRPPKRVAPLSSHSGQSPAPSTVAPAGLLASSRSQSGFRRPAVTCAFPAAEEGRWEAASGVCATGTFTAECFPGGSMIRNPLANPGDARNTGSIPGWERFPGGGDGNPLQWPCLESSRARGAWWVKILGAAKS